ncbi:sensor domain-containing diguanylate cyclase [Massilia atriviolacea]|uniref:Sensor domain-containing diguanylate cyclase n=1 Tax=Massilia atriviolacea TaxID=2495579 RepID=A0A430HKR8_9BURK|nr:sensor domain-containing diguanylate cyclase [Massilia atriviolacea]
MPSASALRRSARRLFRVLLLPCFALALVASMWITLFHQMGVERAAAHHDAVVGSQALARVLSEHVSHILRQSDHATQLFKLKFEETDGALRLPEFSQRNGLLDSVLPAKLNLPMALLDRDGQVVDSANGFAAAGAAGAPWFQALARGSGDTPQFTTPLIEARSGKWMIQIARRLNAGAGRFAGAIVIMIDPLYFVDDYDRVHVDDEAALFLWAHDARLTIGRVGERLFVGEKLGFRARSHGSDELVPTAPPDRIERIYSFSDMDRYALVAVVGITERSAMAKFERHRIRYLSMALGATLAIVLVTALLMRQSARLRASMRAARDAQATSRAAAEGSLDGVMFLKARRNAHGELLDFSITDINDKGAALFGHARADLIGQGILPLLPGGVEPPFLARYAQVLSESRPLEEEVELRTPGERVAWIRHQIVPLPDGVAVSWRDISARKLAELEISGNRGFLQSLIEHLPLLIYVKSVRPASFGTMVVWNKAAEAATGYAADEVIGKTDCSAFAPDFALCSPEEDRAMMASPAAVDLPEKPLRRPDGELRYLHTVSVPLFDNDGVIEYILCIAEDVTRRHEQDQNLRNSEAQLTAITNASPLGLIRADLRGACTYVNRMFETITGLAREQALGRGWKDALHPQDRDSLDGIFQHQRRNAEPFKKVVRCLHPDGRLVWASIKVAAVRIGERIEGFVGTIDDITTLLEAEMALRESEARLRTIADTLPAMVAYIDANQVYRFHNRAYDREFGGGGACMSGMTVRQTVGEKRFATLEPYILRALKGETLVFEEHDEGDGGERALEVTYIPQLGEDGVTVVGFHVMRQDITSQKREKKRLLKLAQVDALTGLANRAGFLHKLGMAMRESADEGQLMALMYMDIDHFKPVNDTHGHHVGDALLKAFSARLTQTLRASDTVARMGGDEFTIIMEKLARPEDAAAIAAKIVGAMQAPFELGTVTVSVSASIGLAYFSGGAADPDALLQQADMQLYQAKQAGRNTWRAAA